MKLKLLLGLCLLTVANVVWAQSTHWTVNVDDIDIKEFITDIATLTKRTIIVEPRVSGNVTVSSDQQLSLDGVWAVFRAVMRAHGFEVVESDGVYMVISTAVARTFGDTRQGLPDADGNQLVTELVALTHVSSLEIVKLARNISPNYGHLAAISDPNVVIITDYADNVQKLVQLVKDLDKPAETDLRVIKLQETLVVEMAELISQLVQDADARDNLKILANQNSNSIVVSGAPHRVAEVIQIITALDLQPDEPKNVRVFNLRFADATETATLINNIMAPRAQAGDSASDTGIIGADENQNAIVVRGNSTFISSVESLINQLDIRRAQALIEAAVVEITLTDSDSFALELGVADNSSGNAPLATTTVSGLLAALMQSLQTDEGEPVQASDALGVLNSPTLSLGKVDPNGLSFGVIVNALASQSAANFLSTPHITAVDNAESTIIVGQDIPIRTGSLIFQNDNSTIPRTQMNRKPIGVTLRVRPFINHDGTIRMEVYQKVENVINPELGIGDTGFADIVTSLREVTTEVIADNGQTIVIGGLIGDDETTSIRKVPLLGDIPLLGRLFRSTSKSVLRRHLLVFIRPTVLETPDEIREENARKFRPIWEVELKQNGDNRTEAESEPLPPLEGFFDGKSN